MVVVRRFDRWLPGHSGDAWWWLRSHWRHRPRYSWRCHWWFPGWPRRTGFSGLDWNDHHCLHWRLYPDCPVAHGLTKVSTSTLVSKHLATFGEWFERITPFLRSQFHHISKSLQQQR